MLEAADVLQEGRCDSTPGIRGLPKRHHYYTVIPFLSGQSSDILPVRGWYQLTDDAIHATAKVTVYDRMEASILLTATDESPRQRFIHVFSNDIERLTVSAPTRQLQTDTR